jgi:flagellar biosynthesis protein FliP
MKKRILIAMMVCVMSVIALAVPALANPATAPDMATIMGDGIGSLITDILLMIAVVVPSALILFGIFFGIRKVISLLRGVGG